MTDAAAEPERALPFEGINVLEFSSFISASYAGTLLGDFGADVVKVERPSGDPQRALGTIAHGDDRSLWWHALARNKRSITLDLTLPDAQNIAKRLIVWADLIIENYRPLTLEGWGLGWDVIHALNPQASLLRISGYGQNGPRAAQPSFERVAQAYSGLMFVTGERDGPPQRAGLPICDYTTGLWGAFGLAMTLLAQMRHGTEGQVIDHAIYASILPFTGEMAPVHDLNGAVPQRSGNRSFNAAPGDACRTNDDHWVFVAVTGDAVFRRMLTAIGRDEFLDDPRFATNTVRLENRATLDQALSDWVGSRNLEEVLETLQHHDVPCAPVQSIADLLNDAHTEERGDFMTAALPSGATVRTPAILPRLDRTPGEIRRPAPRIGEHTTEVLSDLGFTADEQDQFADSGALGKNTRASR